MKYVIGFLCMPSTPNNREAFEGVCFPEGGAPFIYSVDLDTKGTPTSFAELPAHVQRTTRRFFLQKIARRHARGMEIAEPQRAGRRRRGRPSNPFPI